MPMAPMLAFTIRSSNYNYAPFLLIDVGRNETAIRPDSPQVNSYWFVFIDAKNPRVKAKEWVWPGKQNADVPPGIDTYMQDPNYIFAVVTQSLITPCLPQGPLYNFLAKYGGGRALQRLEQIGAAGTVLACGGYSMMSYILTSSGGPRVPGQPAPASYEIGGPSDGSQPAILLMSLMAQPNGGPPYGLCDSYTWTSPPVARA